MSSSLSFVGITDSQSDDAWSSAVLRTLGGLLPPHADMSTVDITGFPPYISYMDDVVGCPDVNDVRSPIQECDGILIVTPETGGRVPNVLRNALRWLSQPVGRSCLLRKPVFICSFSMSNDGGIHAQRQLSKMLSDIPCHIRSKHNVAIGHIDTLFADGVFANTDEMANIRSALSSFVRDVCAHHWGISMPWRDSLRPVGALDREVAA